MPSVTVCLHGNIAEHCPICNHKTFIPTPLYTEMARGCICPPGANKECERPDCPRRNPFKEAAG